MPNVYTDSITIEAFSGKNAPIITMYMGSLALQDIKGVTNIVTRRL